MITVAPTELVFQRAKVLDRERREGRVRGPLHRMPIVIKVRISSKIDQASLKYLGLIFDGPGAGDEDYCRG
jgi:hypothetical protein